jgi:hypothetical protein
LRESQKEPNDAVNQLCALSSSNGNSRWRERMRRSVVQNGTRRAKLCTTSNRSNGSRVQSSISEWLTRVSKERSSTMNRLSSDTVLTNRGLVTESRPTSARNWILKKEIGETPQGRYRSNQEKLARRFASRTIQIRKWVSRSTVTTGAAKRRVLDRAIPTTSDQPRLPAGPSGFSCSLENVWHCLALPGGDSPAFALDCNYFTAKGIIRQLKPMFSGWGCLHVFHMYNVQKTAPCGQAG